MYCMVSLSSSVEVMSKMSQVLLFPSLGPSMVGLLGGRLGCIIVTFVVSVSVALSSSVTLRVMV